MTYPDWSTINSIPRRHASPLPGAVDVGKLGENDALAQKKKSSRFVHSFKRGCLLTCQGAEDGSQSEAVSKAGF